MIRKGIYRKIGIFSVIAPLAFLTISSTKAGFFSITSPPGIIGPSPVPVSSEIMVSIADGNEILDVNVIVTTVSVTTASGDAVLNLNVTDDNSNTVNIFNGTSVPVSTPLAPPVLTVDLKLSDQAGDSYTILPGPTYQHVEEGPPAYQPNPGTLSEFNGNSFNNGTWTLHAASEGANDEVSIVEWTLEVTTVPEPQTYLMFATMLLGAGFVVIRNRRKQEEQPALI